MLRMDPKQFELMRSASWSEIFQTWRDNESRQPRWINHYTSHGYTSWEEWRQKGIEELKLSDREWFLYRILSPAQTIPNFWGGPFRSWREAHYGKKETLTFADLVKSPKISGHEIVKQLAAQFPGPTALIGLVQKEKVIIFEGMHRCCAVALVASWNQKISAQITIALTDFSDEEIPFFAQDSKSQNP